MPLSIQTLQEELDIAGWELPLDSHGKHLIIPARLPIFISHDVIRECDRLGVEREEVCEILKQDANELALYRRETFNVEIDIGKAEALRLIFDIRNSCIVVEMDRYSLDEPETVTADVTLSEDMHDKCEQNTNSIRLTD